MPDTQTITATLKNAVLVNSGLGRVASGEIEGDTKGRFNDGVRVTTSRILEGPDADGIIVTRNSVYKLELAGDGPTSEDPNA